MRSLVVAALAALSALAAMSSAGPVSNVLELCSEEQRLSLRYETFQECLENLYKVQVVRETVCM